MDQCAHAVLVVGALALGIIGFVRLSRAWGVDMVPALAGSLVFVAGPATRGLADAGAIPTLVGIGVLPWAVLIATAPWPPSARRRVGRVAGAFLVFSVLGVVSRLLLATALCYQALRVSVCRFPSPVGMRSRRTPAVGTPQGLVAQSRCCLSSGLPASCRPFCSTGRRRRLEPRRAW